MGLSGAHQLENHQGGFNDCLSKSSLLALYHSFVARSISNPSTLKCSGGCFSETFDDPTLLGWEHSPEAQAMDGALRIPSDNFAFMAASGAM